MMKFEIYILQKKSQDPKMYQEAMGEYLKTSWCIRESFCSI